MSHGKTPVSAGPSGGEANGPALYDLIRRGRSFSGHEQNCCFLNMGNERFADISAASGFNFPDDGRAIGQVDWDLDGDLDFWIANRNGPQVRLLLNELPTKNKSVTLLLEGTNCNRDAIGARVEVVASDGGSTLLRTVRAGDGFLAQSSKRVHVGLGDREISSVIVRWPGGAAESFSGIKAGGHYRLTQGVGTAEPLETDGSAKVVASRVSEPPAAASAHVFLSAMMTVPDINYRGSDGTPQVIRGTTTESEPTLINLWASWCAPCAEELQEWSQQANELRGAGLRIVAISVDSLDDQSGSTANAQALLDRIKFPFEFGFAESKTVEQLQLIHDHLFDAHQQLPVPSSLLIDKQGRVAGLYRGRVSTDVLKRDVARCTSSVKSRILDSTPFAGKWQFHRVCQNPLDLIWKWLERGWVDESVRYIDQQGGILAEHYNFHKLLVLAGNGVLGQGDVRQAIRLYERALVVQPNDGDAHNNLAWLFATHPNDEIRDGAAAVKHAEESDRLNPENASVLDTLAASYAEQGLFEEAIAAVQRGIRLAEAAGQRDLVEAMRQHLGKYESKRPVRME